MPIRWDGFEELRPVGISSAFVFEAAGPLGLVFEGPEATGPYRIKEVKPDSQASDLGVTAGALLFGDS